MRNNFALTALLLASMVLTGCREDNTYEPMGLPESASKAQYEGNSSNT